MTHQHRTPRGCATCEAWPSYARHITAGLSYINGRLDHLDDQLTRQQKQLTHIRNQGDNIMTSQEAADAAAAQLTKALGEIRTLVDTLNTDIVDLTAQVAGGNTVDLSAVTAVAQQLDDIVPDAPVA